MNVSAHIDWTAWNNSPITLFHGTVMASARSIQTQVDLSFGDPETDFGKGLYTTTYFRQATDWAERKAATSVLADAPAVVKITLSRIALAELEQVTFIRGSQDATDFWRFVFHCRSGGRHIPQQNRYYDVACGPVAAVWEDPPRREVFAGFDQISFHTAKAEELLNSKDCRREIIHDWR